MKTKEYYASRDAQIIGDINTGASWLDVAVKYNITVDAVRHVCIKAQLYVPKKQLQDTKKRDSQILQFRVEGKTYKEIGNELGCSLGTARRICNDAGIDAETIRKERNRKCKELREQGYNNEQIAQILDVSLSTVSKACKGITPVKRDYTNCFKASNDIAIERTTEKYTVLLEKYGYKDVKRVGHSNKFIAICKVCSFEQTFFIDSLKHNSGLGCKGCKEIEKQKQLAKEQQEKEKRQRQLEKTRAERAERQREERKLWLDTRRHDCPVCGETTTNKLYCSSECANKANNAKKDIRRRTKLKDAIIDNDISLEKLYRKDNGTCYLCGGQCDYSDHSVKDGWFIVGENYPSIDHVMPLSKGGLHSWNNVRLAHHKCNSIKKDKLLEQDGKLHSLILPEDTGRDYNCWQMD